MVTVGSYNIWAQNSPSVLGNKNAQGTLTPQEATLFSAYNRPWNERKVQIVSNIASSNLDIVSLEEVTQEAFNDLVTDLASQGYQSAAPWISDHATSKTGIAVFYRTHKVLPLSVADIVSHTNKKKQSCIVDFKIIDPSSPSAGKVVRFAGCHLVGGPKRTEGDTQLDEVRQSVNSHAQGIDLTVITGDFNQDQSPSTGTHFNRTDILLGDHFYSHDPSSTPDETEIGTNRHIDWIFAKALHPQDTFNIQKINSSQLPIASDHRLVAAHIDMISHFTPPSLPNPATALNTDFFTPQSNSLIQGLSPLNPSADKAIHSFAEWINTTYPHNKQFRSLVSQLHAITAAKLSLPTLSTDQLRSSIRSDLIQASQHLAGFKKYILPELDKALSHLQAATPTPTPTPTPTAQLVQPNPPIAVAPAPTPTRPPATQPATQPATATAPQSFFSRLFSAISNLFSRFLRWLGIITH